MRNHLVLPWKIATVTTASDFSEKSCRMNAVKILLPIGKRQVFMAIIKELDLCGHFIF